MPFPTRSPMLELLAALWICAIGPASALDAAKAGATWDSLGSGMLRAHSQMAESYRRGCLMMGYDVGENPIVCVTATKDSRGRAALKVFRDGECFFLVDPKRGRIVEFESQTQQGILNPTPITSRKEAIRRALGVLKRIGASHGRVKSVSKKRYETGNVVLWIVGVGVPPMDGVEVGYGGWGCVLSAKKGNIVNLYYEAPAAPTAERARKLSLEEAKALALQLLQRELKAHPNEITFGKSSFFIAEGPPGYAGPPVPRFVWMFQVFIGTGKQKRIEVVHVDCSTRKATWLR